MLTKLLNDVLGQGIFLGACLACAAFSLLLLFRVREVAMYLYCLIVAFLVGAVIGTYLRFRGK